MTTAAPAPRPLLAAIRPLLLAGWAVAAVRLALDALVPDAAMWFGVYWLMPVVLLVLGIRRALDDLPWPRLQLGMLVTALLVWGLPNLLAYGIAQFAGWTHGRFTPGERGPPIGETAGAKLLAAFLVATGTSVAGGVWLVVWSTLLVWLPAVRRRRRAGPAA